MSATVSSESPTSADLPGYCRQVAIDAKAASAELSCLDAAIKKPLVG